MDFSEIITWGMETYVGEEDDTQISSFFREHPDCTNSLQNTS